MSTSKYSWFRMYSEFLNDPKIIALAFEDQRHYIGLLALKCDGALDAGAAPDLLDRIVAQRLWVDHAVIREVKKRLVAAGLISDDWQPLAWAKRQMLSDSSTARVAKHREKKKQAEAGNGGGNVSGNGDGNGDETFQQRQGNGLDTDTDTDKEKEEEETVKELEPAGPRHAETSPAAQPAKQDPESKPSTTGKRLPDDWRLPKSWGEWAIAERPEMTPDEVRRQAAMFADHWQSLSGKDGRRADWEKTWRNWIRRANLPRAGRAAGQAAPETAHQRSQRERVAVLTPRLAQEAPQAAPVGAEFFRRQAIDVQAREVAALPGGAQ